MDAEQAFYVQCTGQVESGDFGALDNLYCRYAFHFGHDWTIAAVRVTDLWSLLLYFARAHA
jgi:hypothetical protein